ncbi:MAG: hypothetical protein AAF616_11030, partial [Bacteroidota bacterium]
IPLVNKQGQEVLKMETDSYGTGIIQFVAEKTQSYQLVIEDREGNFTFADLPAVCTDCHSISVNEMDQAFIIKISGRPQGKRLQIRDEQNILWIREDLNDSELVVPFEILPKKLMVVELFEGKQKLSSRLLFNAELKSLPIKPSKSVYKKREKVTLNFSAPENANLSVKVVAKRTNVQAGLAHGQQLTGKVKVEGLESLNGQLEDQVEILLLKGDFYTESIYEQKTFEFLPEKRFDLLAGKLSGNAKQQSRIITLSLSGDDYQFRVGQIDSLNRFEFSILPFFGSRNGHLQLLEGESQTGFEMENEFYEEYPTFPAIPLQIDSAKIDEIVQRSLKNQVENAYYFLRSDSIFNPIQNFSQFEFASSYRLEDYKRFPTLKDSFLEYILSVGVKKKKEDYSLNIRVPSIFPDSRSSLLLMDGLSFSSEQVLGLTPYAVETIEVLDNRFYFGNVIFDGMISFKTVDRNYGEIRPDSYAVLLKGEEYPKRYFTVDHSSPSTLPDTRLQLFWEPNISSAGDISLEFFTSDVPGIYEIGVEGVHEDGTPLSYKGSFEVR